MRRVLGIGAVVACGLVCSCSTIGSSGGGASELPSNGAGPFRRLEGTEITGGVAVAARGGLVESGMALGVVHGGDAVLFYAFAPVRRGGDPDAGVPEGDAGPGAIDPARFGARDIRRTPLGEPPQFLEGVAVLTAAETWEDGEVFDPWAVSLPDGRVRLYYAGRGGIGIAEAAARDGDLARVGDAPVLMGAPDEASGATPRRPSVTARPGGGVVMYYEAGGGIYAATSDDGLVFTRAGAVALPVSGEAWLSAPGAATVTTPAGRAVVRLYYGVHRADGTDVVAVAASEDGRAFERALAPAFSGDAHEDFPAPLVLDARTTLLFLAYDSGTRTAPSRALAPSVSPGSIRF